MRGDELVEDARDALARQRGIDFNGQALSSDQIKDVERTKPAAIDQHILHEVHTPGLAALPGPLLDGPRRDRDPFAFAPPHEQPFCAVEPIHPFVVNHAHLSLQKHMQPPIPPARSFASQDAQAFTNRRFI